jgi:glutaredoxin-related protein
MNFKKTVCTLLAVMTVVCGFSACSGDTASEDETQSTVSSSQEEAQAEDVTATADKLKSEIEFEDELVEFDSAKIEKIIGVAEDKYTSAKVYVSSSGATPEEIACFEAVDETAAGDIKTALEARIEAQKNTFTDYKPEQAPKLESPVLKVNGNNVYMCISGDNSKAEEIIG